MFIAECQIIEMIKHIEWYIKFVCLLLKARGKSGPLFHFDVRDDIRLVSDASVEKEESHAGEH